MRRPAPTMEVLSLFLPQQDPIEPALAIWYWARYWSLDQVLPNGTILPFFPRPPNRNVWNKPWKLGETMGSKRVTGPAKVPSDLLAMHSMVLLCPDPWNNRNTWRISENSSSNGKSKTQPLTWKTASLCLVTTVVSFPPVMETDLYCW